MGRALTKVGVAVERSKLAKAEGQRLEDHGKGNAFDWKNHGFQLGKERD